MNMYTKSVALETSQPETSNEARDLQPANIPLKSVTEDTSQPERERDVRAEHS